VSQNFEISNLKKCLITKLLIYFCFEVCLATLFTRLGHYNLLNYYFFIKYSLLTNNNISTFVMKNLVTSMWLKKIFQKYLVIESYLVKMLLSC